MKFTLFLIAVLSIPTFANSLGDECFKGKKPEEGVPVSKYMESTRVILASNPNLKATQVFSTLLQMKAHASVREIMEIFQIPASVGYQVAEHRMENSDSRLSNVAEKDRPSESREVLEKFDLDCLKKQLEKLKQELEFKLPRGEYGEYRESLQSHWKYKKTLEPRFPDLFDALEVERPFVLPKDSTEPSSGGATR